MKLYMNEFGLLKSEDGQWGIRQVGPKWFAIQYRPDATDPWSWNILEHKTSQSEAITRMNEFAAQFLKENTKEND